MGEDRQEDRSNGTLIPEEAVVTTGEEIFLLVEVSAGNRRQKFPDGYNPWRKAIGISVKAPPVGGKANKEIVALIAERLDISPQHITILSGHTSSLKRIQITGVSASRICSLPADG